MTDLAKMNKLINALSDAPFQYGKNDCYIFTAKLVKEWHGKDYVKHHAVYKNKKQADEYMARFGGIEKLTTGTLGYSCKPEDCQDGDVVSCDVGSGVAVGFVFNGTGLFKYKKTVVKVPLDDCRLGWRIR
jgi:hypothetical protein